jgi:1-aminocyclopropane-1-carboxylate deaminase/D-cysteine desulfhydrase-like pyridoxal-dependent ACC family enzyme
MRIIFGTLGMLIVLAVVGLLAKKQLSAQAVLVAPATAGTAAGVPAAAAQQQYKQAIENAMQQPRPEPDEQK